MRNRIVPVMLLGLLLWRPDGIATAQVSEDYKKHPGYIDLSFVSAFGEPQKSVEIFLTPGLVKLIAALDEDRELESVLKKLVMIKVYTFEVNRSNRHKFESKIDDLRKKLKQSQWIKFIHVKEDTDRTEVYIRETNDEIQGLTILSIEDREVTFVNIVGIIDLESIGKLSRRYNIPKLDSLQIEKKEDRQ